MLHHSYLDDSTYASTAFRKAEIVAGVVLQHPPTIIGKFLPMCLFTFQTKKPLQRKEGL